MYTADRDYEFRPNTRKIYEEHYGCSVPENFHVHHKLPVRLGGTHDPENLQVLSVEDHAKAHLELYEQYGDPRDLCAYYMILGYDREAHLVACSMGGVASQFAKRMRGEPNGFQLFSPEKRKKVAARAGRKGGLRQRDLGIGIHAHSDERKREVALLGAQARLNEFVNSAAQASRGRRGGVKNIGALWYNDGKNCFKYTKTDQEKEPFDEFITRTGMNRGKGKSKLGGSKFYNDGHRQFMFVPSKHSETFAEFLARTGYKEGRIK